MSPKWNDDLRCYCGRPLHYKDRNIERQVMELVQKFGPYIDVTVAGNKTYRVPRHYIALHGIHGKDLSALGFHEVSKRK